LYVSRDTGRMRRDIEVGTNNPHIRRCDGVSHRVLHPVQGLESGRGGGDKSHDAYTGVTHIIVGYGM
jgi:hypothetical protein